MNPHEDLLWARLLAFNFDETGDALTFTQRLARENGWNLGFARRVVEEYRRFLYLALRAGHSVTPSDEVDQAWHLHLVYSRSYWDELCAQVLQHRLHHGPTRGGQAEDDRFLDAYEATRTSYRRCFGSEPPADIWPEPEVRFTPQARWQRVDLASHWCLPKLALRRTGLGLLGILGLSGAAVGCSSVNGEELIGNGLFLMAAFLVAAFLVVAAGLGWLIIRTARGGGSGGGSNSKRGSSGCGDGGIGGGCAADSSGGHHSHSDGSSGCGSSGCGSSGCGGGGGCGGD
jgi:hypothetical protein